VSVSCSASSKIALCMSTRAFRACASASEPSMASARSAAARPSSPVPPIWREAACAWPRSAQARVVGIELDRAPAQPNDCIVAMAAALVAGDAVLSGHEIELIGLGVARATPLDRLLLRRQQPDLQRGDDRGRDLVLQFEDIAQIAVVALRPDVASAGAVDHLPRYPHP